METSESEKLTRASGLGIQYEERGRLLTPYAFLAKRPRLWHVIRELFILLLIEPQASDGPKLPETYSNARVVLL
jgi:hypothetical protein